MVPPRQLGRNGPQVSGLGLGLMGLSVPPTPPSHEQAFEVLNAAIENGCTFWDSSDAYADNSEMLKAYFDKTGNRDKVFLATKVGIQHNVIDGKHSFEIKGDAEFVTGAVDKVLARLGLPYVDLLYQQRIDTKVPIEVTVGALAELVKAGKVRHLGLSECSAATLRRAHAVHPITAVQVEYSPFSLDIEQNDLLRTCRELGVAVVAYSPIGRGFFGGQVRSRADFNPADLRLHFPRFSEENFPKNLALVDKFAEFAQKRNVSISQYALAWLLAQGTDIIPIPGTTKTARVKENLGAASIDITKEEDEQIRKILSSVPTTGGRYPPGMGGDLYADTPALNE